MRYQSLIPTRPDASVICLGAFALGSTIAEAEAFRLLDTFEECGGNFIDTAHAYNILAPGGWGASERTIGAWMRRNGNRESILIGTKGCHPHPGAMETARVTPEAIQSDMDESLERLATDWIDLYWLHRDDPAVPVGELIDAVNGHLEAGRIRAFGASNWTVARIEAARQYAQSHSLVDFCAIQVRWSLARPIQPAASAGGALALDDDAYRYHCERGLPVVPYSSQAKGFFSGRYKVEDLQDPEKLKQPALKYFGALENFERLERVRAIAREHNVGTNQIALAWLFSHPFPVFPIAGCRTIEQVRDSCAAGDIRPDKAMLTNLMP